MELMPEAEDNVWDLSDRERQVMGIHALPTSLSDAVREMKKSELVASTLGEQVFDYVIRNKRKEWTEYRQQITRQELEQFLRLFPGDPPMICGSRASSMRAGPCRSWRNCLRGSHGWGI